MSLNDTLAQWEAEESAVRARLSDAIDGGQPDPEPLLWRQIHTCNTCHVFLPVRFAQRARILLQINNVGPDCSALPLLVTRIGAEHANHAVAAHGSSAPQLQQLRCWSPSKRCVRPPIHRWPATRSSIRALQAGPSGAAASRTASSRRTRARRTSTCRPTTRRRSTTRSSTSCTGSGAHPRRSSSASDSPTSPTRSFATARPVHSSL